MKDKLKKIRGTIISGIILFIPVFVLIAIFEKVYNALSGFGKNLAALLEIDSIIGVSAVPILTTILLLLVFYVSGVLVRFAFITKAREWIENSILTYIPNYSKYKAKMLLKLQPVIDERQPALVDINGNLKPCLIVNSDDSKSVIFLPSSPDTDNGEVIIVDTNKVKKIDMSVKEFKQALLLSGKGFKTANLK